MRTSRRALNQHSGGTVPFLEVRERPMIHVFAIITAKPGMRDTILNELRAILPAVHAENGCIEYGPATDAPEFDHFQTRLGPDGFVSIEKWGSPEALKA